MSRYRKPKPEAAPSDAPVDGNKLFSKTEAALYMGVALYRVRTLVMEGALRIAPGGHKGEKITKAECDRYIASLDRNAVVAPKKPRRVRKPRTYSKRKYNQLAEMAESAVQEMKQRGRDAAAEMMKSARKTALSVPGRNSRN
jgi:hypothetical protein